MVLQHIVQQTQKIHMYEQLQQSTQQTYSGLSLGAPVCAKDFISKFTATDGALILMKCKRPTVTPFDETAYDEWNADSWNEVTTVNVDSVNGNEAPDTDVKQVAGAEAPGPSCAFGVLEEKLVFHLLPIALVHQLRHTSSFENFEDYFNPLIVSTLPLYATSPSFAAAVNIRSCPSCKQGGA